MHSFSTDDGAAIIIDGLEPLGEVTEPRRPDGVLGGEVELAVAEGVSEAVAAGVTFEVLRSAAHQLVERGWKPRTLSPSAETVVATLTKYLLTVGYLDIRATEVRHIPGQGWLVVATADGTAVRGRADPSGQLLHVRVG